MIAPPGAHFHLGGMVHTLPDKEVYMFWEEQMNIMLESGYLDQENANDLAVTYAAETGDDSLFSAPNYLIPIYVPLIGMDLIRKFAVPASWGMSRRGSRSHSGKGLITGRYKSLSRTALGGTASSTTHSRDITAYYRVSFSVISSDSGVFRFGSTSSGTSGGTPRSISLCSARRRT